MLIIYIACFLSDFKLLNIIKVYNLNQLLLCLRFHLIFQLKSRTSHMHTNNILNSSPLFVKFNLKTPKNTKHKKKKNLKANQHYCI